MMIRLQEAPVLPEPGEASMPAPAPRRARRPGENYPFDHWWVLALGEEVRTGQLLSRKVLGFDVVVFRLEDGAVAVLDDRCKHRGLPLSMGWQQGDHVVCGYHGFEYDGEGHLVKVPTQPNCPRKGSIRSFPAVESAPFIWIWTGDPRKARRDQVPFYPWLNDPACVYASERIHVRSNYMLLKENVLDLTHFPFAHRSTLGVLDDYAESAPEVTYEDGKVTFTKPFLNQKLSPFYNDDIGLGDKLVDRRDVGSSLSPGEHVARITIDNPEPAPGQMSQYFFVFQHMTTPEGPKSHHYWWVMARNYKCDAAAIPWFKDVANTAFQEDKVILEAIQRRVDEAADPAGLEEVSVLADRPGLLARRQLQAWLDREDSEA